MEQTVRGVLKRAVRLIAAAALLAIALAACKPGDPGRSTGAYPIDLLQEMHYNQSYKAQEPPRLLPPQGTYPIEGGALPAPPARSEEARALAPTYPDDAVVRGALLYRQNCSVCHGQTAGGDGFVGLKLDESGATRPPAFGSPRVQGLEPGEVYASISRGFGFMSMPRAAGPPTGFEGLLSEEDRWALVALVAAPEDQRRGALESINDLPECERTARLVELREDRQLGERLLCPQG